MLDDTKQGRLNVNVEMDQKMVELFHANAEHIAQELERKANEEYLKQEAILQREECKNLPPNFVDTVLDVQPGCVLSVGLAWDFYEGQTPVDLDCAAVVYNNIGVLHPHNPTLSDPASLFLFLSLFLSFFLAPLCSLLSPSLYPVLC